MKSCPPMSNFRTIDRQTGFLLPPSVDEWLPERHLARFIVEVIEALDLRSMSGGYRGSGSKSYHPRLLLGVLVYGYATGVFSSRKLERATYDSVQGCSTLSTESRSGAFRVM
jgi:transposase